MSWWKTWLWLIGSLFITSLGHSQINQVRVTDPSGEPLAGVTIYAKNHRQEWFTNQGGFAILGTVPSNDTLIFNLTGFNTEVIPVQNLLAEIYLTPWSETLNEVLVTGRRNDLAARSIQELTLIDKKDIELRQSNSVPAILEASGEVFVQRSQQGGGSPILRGFEANRILLVVDGVRMNNAIYRSGHLQNALTIDGQALERTEVILGPGSLLYGSDALGGVIHFRTKEVALGKYPGDHILQTKAGYQFSTADLASVAHAQLNYSNHKWGGLTSISWSDFGDLRSGSNRPDDWPEFGKRNVYVSRIGGQDSIIWNSQPDLQRFSGYSQLDLLQKIRFRPNRFINLEANIQYSTTTHIPRYDALTETRAGLPRFAEWYYGPQTRLLTALSVQHSKPTTLYDRARIQLSFQFIEEDRINRVFQDEWREVNEEDVLVGGLTLDLDKKLSPDQQWKLKYGAEMQFNQVHSNAWRENIEEGEVDLDINTRYPGDGSQFWQGGGYVTLEWDSRDSAFQLEAGGRYSFTHLYTRFNDQGPIKWPPDFLEGISHTNQALTGSFGLRWRPGQQWSIYALSSTAFRAPNLDDFGKIRENNGFVTVPNVDLKPEKAWTNELRIHKNWSWGRNRLSLALGGFFTLVNDLITRLDYRLPNGDDFFVSRGDTLFVQANVNTDKGRIWGANARLQWQFANQWAFHWTHSFTYGEKELKDPESLSRLWVPLEHIPPQFGRLGLRWSPANFQLEGALRYQGAKSPDRYGVTGFVTDEACGQVLDREGSSDNIEYGLIEPDPGPCKSPYQGLYAWMTIDLYSSWQATSWLQLNAAVENLLDQHYRTFGSGISAPGRNWKVGVRLSF